MSSRKRKALDLKRRGDRPKRARKPPQYMTYDDKGNVIEQQSCTSSRSSELVSIRRSTPTQTVPTSTASIQPPAAPRPNRVRRNPVRRVLQFSDQEDETTPVSASTRRIYAPSPNFVDDFISDGPSFTDFFPVRSAGASHTPSRQSSLDRSLDESVSNGVSFNEFFPVRSAGANHTLSRQSSLDRLLDDGDDESVAVTQSIHNLLVPQQRQRWTAGLPSERITVSGIMETESRSSIKVGDSLLVYQLHDSSVLRGELSSVYMDVSNGEWKLELIPYYKPSCLDAAVPNLCINEYSHWLRGPLFYDVDLSDIVHIKKLNVVTEMPSFGTRLSNTIYVKRHLDATSSRWISNSEFYREMDRNTASMYASHNNITAVSHSSTSSDDDDYESCSESREFLTDIANANYRAGFKYMLSGDNDRAEYRSFWSNYVQQQCLQPALSVGNESNYRGRRLLHKCAEEGNYAVHSRESFSVEKCCICEKVTECKYKLHRHCPYTPPHTAIDYLSSGCAARLNALRSFYEFVEENAGKLSEEQQRSDEAHVNSLYENFEAILSSLQSVSRMY